MSAQDDEPQDLLIPEDDDIVPAPDDGESPPVEVPAPEGPVPGDDLPSEEAVPEPKETPGGTKRFPKLGAKGLKGLKKPLKPKEETPAAKPPKARKPLRARRGGGKKLVAAIVFLGALGAGGFFLRHPALYFWNVRRLNTATDKETITAAKASMDAMREYAIPRLQWDTAPPGVAGRIRAIRAFGRWGVPEAVDAAATASRDSTYPEVREAGILALGDILRSQDATASGSALGKLGELLAEHDRADADRSLLLEQVLSNRSGGEAALRLAVAHLGEHELYLRTDLVDEVDGIWTALLRNNFEDRDARVRRILVERLLDRLTHPAAIPILIRGLDPAHARGDQGSSWVPYVSYDRLRQLTRQTIEYNPYDPRAEDYNLWQEWWKENQHRY